MTGLRNNPLYTIYDKCPRCRGIIINDYDENAQVQKCRSCARSWDLMGNSLEAKEADDETKKMVGKGSSWQNRR